jgi:hypothetical protein
VVLRYKYWRKVRVLSCPHDVHGLITQIATTLFGQRNNACPRLIRAKQLVSLIYLLDPIGVIAIYPRFSVRMKNDQYRVASLEPLYVRHRLNRLQCFYTGLSLHSAQPALQHGCLRLTRRLMLMVAWCTSRAIRSTGLDSRLLTVLSFHFHAFNLISLLHTGATPLP